MSLQRSPGSRALSLFVLLGLCGAAAAFRAPIDVASLGVERDEPGEALPGSQVCEDRAFRKCAALGRCQGAQEALHSLEAHRGAAVVRHER